MFYCDPCGTERGWPVDVFFGASYGSCEICRKPRVCNDVPSSHLPPPKRVESGAPKEQT